MRTARLTVCVIAWLMAALLLLPSGLLAQEEENPDQPYKFSKEELTQMLAPLALYPDALTAQILMASTYPLEVVEADRWRSANKQLQGDDLDSYLQDKPWDPSIKSLCHFPDLLAAMSDKLDQTRKVGDAFLGQEEEVMATIQELRHKAREAGNLQTTEQQKVTVEDDTIRIEPARTEVVYVPVYDPALVYGSWWYPAYPPYYWYYPAGSVSGAYIGFGPGIYFGLNAFSWAWFDWPLFRIQVDFNRTRSFHRHYDRRGTPGPVWTHNPRHRRGVAYRDRITSQRFNSRPPRVSSSSPERRGYPAAVGEQQIRRAPQSTDQGGISRQVAPQRRESGITPGTEKRDTPFRGIGDGGLERRAGERGGTSSRTVESGRRAIGSGGEPGRPAGGGTRIQRQDSFGSQGGQIQRRESGGSRGGGFGGSRR